MVNNLAKYSVIFENGMLKKFNETRTNNIT